MINLPAPNLDLLDRSMDVVRREAVKGDHGTWRQEMWRCNTGMCLAGHVAHLAGAKWAFPHVDNEVNSFQVVTPDGSVTPVYVYATAALGLNRYDTAELFNSENTLDDLEEIVRDIKATHKATGAACLTS